MQDSYARALAWSPNGDILAVGLGGLTSKGGKSRKDGAFLILDAKTLEILHEGRDSKLWIRDVSFSPNGALLAVGSMDNNIYLYAVRDNFKLYAKCSKHNNPISHVDFSSNSEYIQSSCDGFEMLYFDATSGKHINSPSQLKDVEFDSWTCPFGWPVQGIWPEEPDGVNINAVCRSKSKKYVATANAMGTVAIMHYPSLNKGSQGLNLLGHAKEMSNCRFSSDDHYILTLGKLDRAIFQWKLQSTDSKDHVDVAGQSL
jgi:WD40 repeat protein